MDFITVDRITKDYENERGVFDLSFKIEKGEVFGFLGPNGAGKTTTIRQILGFIRPDKGKILIDGMKVSRNYYRTNARIGYLPGEINFPVGMKGMEFIEWTAQMRGLKDMSRAHQILDMLELNNPNSSVKRMSKGMKQKIGIVCAFMHDPDILILDEPTSGLDPLMQETFIELVKDAKSRGKTVLMSSHMFSEIEKTCDRTAIIRYGKLVANVNMNDIQKSEHKIYKIKFNTPGESRRFASEDFILAEINHEKNRVRVTVDDKDINRLILALSSYDVRYISEIKHTLEDYFMHFYDSKVLPETSERSENV